MFGPPGTEGYHSKVWPTMLSLEIQRVGRLQNKVPERAGTLLTFIGPTKLRCTTLTVQVFVFFVLSLSALFLLTGLSALLSTLTRLAGLTLLTGLSAALAGLSALLSLLAILFHIVCHQ